MTVVGFADTADPSAARGVIGTDPHAPGAAREAPQDDDDDDGGGGGPKDDGVSGCHNGGEQIDSCPPAATGDGLV